MAVDANAFPASDLVAVIPEVWSSIVNGSKFPQAVLTNFCLDLSEFAEEGDSIHVPDIYTNQLTSGTQSTEGAEITPVTPLQVDDTISVDTHEYVAFMFGDKTIRQVARKYNLVELYGREAQGVLMNVIEAALAALWSSLTSSVGDTSNGVTDPNIREAISILESRNFSTREMALFFHPETYIPMRHLLVTVKSKLLKLREHLTQAIRSETQKWGRSTTIIGQPFVVEGIV